jgi:CRP/FNR family transcriptional regulator, nitrogen oxide reductase regulator
MDGESKMPQLHAVGPAEQPKYRLLEGLSPRDRELVLAAAAVRRFSANTVVTTHGSPADRLYLLVSGYVRFFYTTPDGRKFLMIWIAPGEVFGGATLLPKATSYLVSCETVKESKALVWDRATIRGFAERFPQIMDNALTIAGEYVDWYMSAHIALSCHTARERLARVLLGLSRAIGEKVSDGIELDVTNEDLANAANITPYTTSRLMSEWQKNRTIVKRRGKVLLRSPEHLILRSL